MAEGGGQRPPTEYRSPYRKADGSLVRIDDPNRPPTTFTKWKGAVSDAIDRFNAGFDRILGGKKPSGGRPAGEFVRPSDIRRANEVVDLHGPIDNPDDLSPVEAQLRQETKGRHPASSGEGNATSLVDDPNARERARLEEIAGRTHPGTDDEFIDVQDPVDKPEDAALLTSVDIANEGTFDEVVAARRLGEKGREAAQAQQGLRLVVDNDPKKLGKRTPPDDNGGGSAA